MEEHPDFENVKSELRAAGYPLHISDHGDPYVERVEYVDRAGNILRVEQRVVAREGMRFLDLEHEVGHVHQFTERFGGHPPLTERMVEQPGWPPRIATDRSNLLTQRQNAIVELHNRLQEYNRLAERGVSPDILAEHADGVAVWRGRYSKAVHGWHGKPTDVTPWAANHFADIPGLMRRYVELGSTL
jgi:hypothetical protein